MKHIDPTSTSAWQDLNNHIQQVKSLHLRDLLRENPDRVEQFTIQHSDLLLDYSKHLVTPQVMTSLVNLARECKLSEGIEEMFRGDPINETEHRAVLHTALRSQQKDPLYVNQKDIRSDIHRSIEKMAAISRTIHKNKWLGYSGKPIRHVVHIGIGGSMLGPQMVCHALKHYRHRNVEIHFVANMDSAEFHEAVAPLDIEETLFIVVSKTFGTRETITNAGLAKREIVNHFGDPSSLSQHMLAVTANRERARAFGLADKNILTIWDWVGGRFSLASAAGLSIMISIGADQFLELLKGMALMDTHFRESPLEINMPVILAVLDVWYTNFFDTRSHAVLPYSHYLRYFPRYVQALEMESNGKGVDRLGRPTAYQTSPVVWGDVGTDGQHAFFQALHQGTQLIPCDFIGFLQPLHQDLQSQQQLLANLIAQAESLAMGSPEGSQGRMDSEPFRRFHGNRPSSMLLIDRLTPQSLGKLIALYEHKTFCQGVIWNIFSFDQWGVELGKQMAGKIESELEEGGETTTAQHDSSTRHLIQWVGRRAKPPVEPGKKK